MAQKIISVSVSSGDKEFMKTRFLSPSKLLQERITQIRDDQDPLLIKQLEREKEHSKALKKKVEFLALRMDKLLRGIEAMDDGKSSDEIQRILLS